MNTFEAELDRRLAGLRQAALFRELRRVDSPQGPRVSLCGREILNFSSNDYLGLANDPLIKTAAVDAIEELGAGAGASRLICGSMAIHHRLEESLAQFKGTEAAITFSSGYVTALGCIGALLGKDDIIVLDKLVHASVVDAARLSGARLRVFAHNDLDSLEAILRWADTQNAPGNAGVVERRRVLIVTESIFSMDGDHAPLREIVELKNRYGAWLMVDEAHATGLYGRCRRGLAEELGVDDEIEVRMGTLGKALGAAGGYVCGSRKLIDYLINRARGFIFSTAPPPAVAAAALAAIDIVRGSRGEELRDFLWKRVEQLMRAFPGLQPRPSQPSAIVPIIIGDESKALDASAELLGQGIFICAVRYPAVARGKARLRLTLSAAHGESDIVKLTGALGLIGHRFPPINSNS